MIHPSTELRLVNPHIGVGVFATARIPRGTLVYVRDAMEIEVGPDDRILHDPNLGPIIERFSYIDARGYRIVSWDIGKHVNHSCRPNTITTGYEFEIAVRDIEPGEQITDDYGLFNLEHALDCACGEPGCRGVVRGDDFDRYVPEWDALAMEALRQCDCVAQPLWPFFAADMRRRLLNFLTTGRSYRSVRCMKYERAAQTALPARINGDETNGGPRHDVAWVATPFRPRRPQVAQEPGGLREAVL
jgi:hypothetical protein